MLSYLLKIDGKLNSVNKQFSKQIQKDSGSRLMFKFQSSQVGSCIAFHFGLLYSLPYKFMRQISYTREKENWNTEFRLCAGCTEVLCLALYLIWLSSFPPNKPTVMFYTLLDYCNILFCILFPDIINLRTYTLGEKLSTIVYF